MSIITHMKCMYTQVKYSYNCMYTFFYIKMFKPNQNYEVDRRILKCDYLRYLPAETSTINTPSSQFYINITREVSAICCLLYSYLE